MGNTQERNTPEATKPTRKVHMHKNNYHVEFKRQNSAQLTLMESPLAKLSNKKNPAEFRH
jgi:hypothetical protein